MLLVIFPSCGKEFRIIEESRITVRLRTTEFRGKVNFHVNSLSGREDSVENDSDAKRNP